MLLCVAMLFCSCGEEERAVLGYEQPVATLVTAAQYSDTQSYLSCFTPEAEAEYKNSDGLKDLEKSYKESYHKNVTIKKAVTMTAKLTETTESGELSASREITVVKIENNWYIFGKVIEKFDLSQKG